MSSFFPYSKPFARLFKEQGEKVSYEKNQHLIWHNDASDWVFFLENGFVRASFTLPNNTDRILGYFVPGMVFAQSGAFMHERDGMLSYTANTSSTLYRMRHRKFLSLVREDTELLNEYLNMTLRNQLLLIDRILYQGEKGLYAKCVRWLLFMAKFYGEPAGRGCSIPIPLTQETVANFLHATRESVNGVLQQLVEEQCITTGHKRITITNVAKLRKKVL